MDFETYYDNIPRIVAGNTPASITRGARLLHRLRQERARDLRFNKLLQATKEIFEKPNTANGRRTEGERKGGRG
jgi:hypothetical protein